MKQEMIEMAKQAASTKPFHEFFPKLNIDLLEAFAKLVAAKEREACAKVCEDSVEYAGDTLADAIRARGEA